MRRRLSGTVTVGIVYALVLVGVYASIMSLSGSPALSVAGSQNQLGGLKTIRLAKNDLSSVVTATGRVVAKAQSNLSFDFPGVVLELPIQEGQHVTAGQLLARQDDTTQQLNLQQADYAVQSAQVVLDKLLKPVDARDVANAEADVKAAEGNYSQLAGAINPATIKAYNLQYQQAVTAAQNAEMLRAGAGGQYATDDPNYQKTVAQVGIAQTNAEIARLKLQQVQNGPSLLAATANIAYSQAILAQVKAGTRQIDVDDAQAQLATAKLQRDQAQQLLDKTRLIAPFAGTVTKINVKLSEVSSGAAVLLTDDSQLYVDVSVAEANIGQIQVGQPVELTVDAVPGVQLTGNVQRIDQMADSNPSVIAYTVRVALDKAEPSLKVGMTANVNFMVGNAQSTLVIPNVYITVNQATGQATVSVVKPDGSLSDIPIKLGLQTADTSEVIDGLHEGDVVALDNSGSVHLSQARS